MIANEHFYQKWEKINPLKVPRALKGTRRVNVRIKDKRPMPPEYKICSLSGRRSWKMFA